MTTDASTTDTSIMNHSKSFLAAGYTSSLSVLSFCSPRLMLSPLVSPGQALLLPKSASTLSVGMLLPKSSCRWYALCSRVSNFSANPLLPLSTCNEAGKKAVSIIIQYNLLVHLFQLYCIGAVSPTTRRHHYCTQVKGNPTMYTDTMPSVLVITVWWLPLESPHTLPPAERGCCCWRSSGRDGEYSGPAPTFVELPQRAPSLESQNFELRVTLSGKVWWDFNLVSEVGGGPYSIRYIVKWSIKWAESLQF